MCGCTWRLNPRLTAQAARRCWIARGPRRRPVRLKKSASASRTGSEMRLAIHACRAARAGAPTGTMRSFDPLPQTRTSPETKSSIERFMPESSATRSPEEYASSSKARSRSASASSPSIATSCTASSGESADGRRRCAFGALRPPQGSSLKERSRSIAKRKNALQPESIRARLLPEIPRPCRVARERRRSAEESPASGASPASALSVATSRRYASRVCAGLVAR